MKCLDARSFGAGVVTPAPRCRSVSGIMKGFSGDGRAARVSAMSNSPRFIHLRVHTEYSLLEGAVRLKKLAGLCDKLAMPGWR